MKLSTAISVNETRWGVRYLLFQLLVLPNLLAAANSILPVPLPAAWLNLTFFVINFTATALIFRRFLRDSLAACMPLLGKIFLMAFSGLLIYEALNILMGMALISIRPDFANVNDASISQMATDSFLLVSLGTVLLVPVTEELLFRGLIFGALYHRSRPAAYLISCGLFASIHVISYVGVYPIDLLFLCFIQYLPAGLCLAWAYTRADSIFCPILMHMLINAIGMYAMR